MSDTINEQHRFAPHDVAGMYSVSVMTVRRWADYHKAHLSADANPPPGKARAFTWDDVQKFKQIKAWRDQGLTVDTINNILSGNVTGAITSTVIDDSVATLSTPQEGLQQAQGIIVALGAMQGQIDAIQRARESDKQMLDTMRQRYVIVFGFGFVAAGIMFLLLIGLAWLYGA